MSAERTQAAERGSEDPWRATFANLWSELAIVRADAYAKGRLTDDPLSWAKTVLIGSMHKLCAGADPVSAGADPGPVGRGYARLDERDDRLWCAACALEACVCVRHQLGPAAGSRRTHLVRRLERQLKEDDRRALSGVADWRVTRPAVAKAGTAALGAVEGLGQEGGDRAALLDQLEEGAVRLAALAVRETFRIRLRGEAGASRDSAPELVEDLLVLAREAAKAGEAYEADNQLMPSPGSARRSSCALPHPISRSCAGRASTRHCTLSRSSASVGSGSSSAAWKWGRSRPWTVSSPALLRLPRVHMPLCGRASREAGERQRAPIPLARVRPRHSPRLSVRRSPERDPRLCARHQAGCR